MDKNAKNEDFRLSEDERQILGSLCSAWNYWVELDDKHPDDDLDMKNAIHSAQKLIAIRVARRVDPETWWQPED